MNIRSHFSRCLLGVIVCWAGLVSSAGMSSAVAGPAAPSVAERESLRQQTTELRRELWHLEEMLALTPLEVGEAITGAEARRAEIERALQGLAARVGTRPGIAPDAASEELLRARGELDSLQARIERRAARRSEVGPQLPATPQREPGDLEIVATATHRSCETALAIGPGRVRGVLRPEVWFRVQVPKPMRVALRAETLDTALSLSLHDRCGASPRAAAASVAGSAEVATAMPAGEAWIRLASTAPPSGLPFTVEAMLDEGNISGRVTRASDGTGVGYATVQALTPAGSYQRQATTTATGEYTLSFLYPGSYLVAVEEAGSLVAERFDDHPCPLGSGCPANTGDLVEVLGSATTSGIDFQLEPGGLIGGSVRLSPEGTAPSVAWVDLHDDSGQWQASIGTDGAGRFRFGGLLGRYRVTAEATGRMRELFEEMQCGEECEIEQGTPLLIGSSADQRVANFTLEALGSVSGRVTSPGGVPLAQASVTVRRTGSMGGEGWAATGPDGTFVIGGLQPGTYVASAYRYLYEQRVWGGPVCEFLGCSSYLCDYAAGTPIAVAIGAPVAGVDFELRPTQPILGRVTKLEGGSALPGVVVRAGTQPACGDAWAETDLSGSYSTQGLPAASYRVLTESSSGAIDEVYDGRPCDLNGCPQEFTPVPVTAEGPTTDIDFALAQGARIHGSVVDAEGQPANYCFYDYVLIYRIGTPGSLAMSCSSGPGGSFAFDGVPAGTYSVRAVANQYYGELFDNLPCIGSCNPDLGTPITVTLGEDRGGIDFVLDRPGRLEGTVRDAYTGAGLRDVPVQAVDSAGNVLTSTSTASSGAYSVERPSADSVYLVAGGSAWERELYPELPCPGVLGVDCLPTDGVAVAVGANGVVSGLDFTVRPWGIHGRVLQAPDLRPAPAVGIDLFDASSLQRLATVLTDEQGIFSVRPTSGGPPGTYLIATDNAVGAVDELWQDVPCPNGPAWLGLCDLALANPIPLGDFGIVDGIDFVLSGWPVFKSGFENGSLIGWSARAPN